MQGAGAGSIVERMVGAAKLDVPTFEAIEHDDDALTQAAIVVAIVAVASGIGAIADNGILGLIGGIIGAIVGWIIFSVVAYFVGTRIIPGENTQATPEQLLRTLGFAQTPNILAIFLLIPILGALISFIGSIWALVAGIIALRQALDTSTGRAIGVGLISFVVVIIVYAIFALIGLGFGAFG